MRRIGSSVLSQQQFLRHEMHTLRQLYVVSLLFLLVNCSSSSANIVLKHEIIPTYCDGCKSFIREIPKKGHFIIPLWCQEQADDILIALKSEGWNPTKTQETVLQKYEMRTCASFENAPFKACELKHHWLFGNQVYCNEPSLENILEYVGFRVSVLGTNLSSVTGQNDMRSEHLPDQGVESPEKLPHAERGWEAESSSVTDLQKRIIPVPYGKLFKDLQAVSNMAARVKSLYKRMPGFNNPQTSTTVACRDLSSIVSAVLAQDLAAIPTLERNSGIDFAELERAYCASYSVWRTKHLTIQSSKQSRRKGQDLPLEALKQLIIDLRLGMLFRSGIVKKYDRLYRVRELP